ncbi:hypothetical protein [Haloprofundus salilacus]|uniref:hypothetical protein n=1 Tax=Haloprofundus salilacus TaxID=2876190 RepID=UPI001CC96C17|nr:hypothetical protein [Haloprofundus salilacus]
MILQFGSIKPALPAYTPELGFVVLLALVTSIVTYLAVRTLLVVLAIWVTDDGTRLGQFGTTAAKGYALLVALTTALGITGFGSFRLLFFLLAVGGLAAFVGFAYRVERSLARRQWS